MNEKKEKEQLILETREDFLKFVDRLENSQEIKDLISYIKDFDTNQSFMSFKNGTLGTDDYIKGIKRNDAIIGYLNGLSLAKNLIIEENEKAKKKTDENKQDNDEVIE